MFVSYVFVFGVRVGTFLVFVRCGSRRLKRCITPHMSAWHDRQSLGYAADHTQNKRHNYCQQQSTTNNNNNTKANGHITDVFPPAPSPPSSLVKPGVYLPDPRFTTGRGGRHYPPEQLRNLLKQGLIAQIVPLPLGTAYGRRTPHFFVGVLDTLFFQHTLDEKSQIFCMQPSFALFGLKKIKEICKYIFIDGV